MKLSFLMFMFVVAFSNLNAADNKTRPSSYDDVESQFSKEGNKSKDLGEKLKAVAEIISEDQVIGYALDKIDPRIANGEIEKLSKEEKAKAMQEIDRETARTGKEIYRYDLPTRVALIAKKPVSDDQIGRFMAQSSSKVTTTLAKRSLDNDEATSACWGWRRWGWGGGCGGWGWGGWGWGGGCGGWGRVTFVNTFATPCLYSTAFVGSAYFW